MKVKQLVQQPNGWTRFHLSVGGFVIKNCRWRPSSGQIFFPLRYDKGQHPHTVVSAHGSRVKRLRELLESGKTETPRDRTPCTLKIHGFGAGELSEDILQNWLIFDFTVRGFKIIGCRWLPGSGSIQLPVSFSVQFNGQEVRWRKKQVVCAFGPHINRLRAAVEKEETRQ